MRRLVLALVPIFVVAPAALGQRVDWRTRATLYGDNTEFFTPYREGETILGGQVWTAARIETSRRTSLLVGAFGDVRWGSDDFLDTEKPILSFRYAAGSSLGVIGTLETERRHGFLDALAVSTLELIRPVEYGLQWIERRRTWDLDIYLNWQKLNTPSQREVFDYGWVARVRPVRQVVLEYQLHGLHHGGQLFDAGVPVTNNGAWAFGITVADTLGPLGLASLQFFSLRSSGNIDPDAPADRPRKGRGTLVRASLSPVEGVELFGIHWRGRDFVAQEGDPNYGSIGFDSVFYRGKRKYLELGVIRRARIDGVVGLDAEFRLHRIDDLQSQALFDSKWEYSYRLVARVPFGWTLVR